MSFWLFQTIVVSDVAPSYNNQFLKRRKDRQLFSYTHTICGEKSYLVVKKLYLW